MLVALIFTLIDCKNLHLAFKLGAINNVSHITL